MKSSLLIIAALLLLGTVVAEDAGHRKKQEGGDQCLNAQVTSCRDALNSDNNERFCDGNCEEVLGEYYKCQGFDTFVILQDEECGTAGTTVGSAVLVSALLTALVATLS